MKKKDILTIFKTLSETIERAETELIYETDFQLMVSVILSAQATDISVNKATKNLYDFCKTPQDFIDLGEEELKNYIKSIGLYQNKARFIIEAANDIKNRFNNKIPDNFDELTSISGVGRKTANVLLNILYDKPVIAVDTHVFRVSNRVGLSKGLSPKEVELDLAKITPKKYILEAHHLLILHGRYVCKARKPKCSECSISSLCEKNNI
ncbi:endonuclease III [bacterium]|nr:endonuclease III [bacterium]